MIAINEVPPNRFDDEERFLALILFDNSIMDHPDCQLPIEDLYSVAHQRVYATALDFREAGKTFSVDHLSDALKGRPDANADVARIGTTAHKWRGLSHRAAEFATAIRKSAELRRGIESCLNYIRLAQDNADDGDISAARDAIPDPSASVFGWPVPKSLPDPMPAVMPFDYALLPDALRPWIQDIAERTQCPPDFPAVGAMVGLASLLGRKIAIRPKRYDDWTVIPNLWGAVIGRPGIMKSPALSAVLKPLRRIECDAKDDYIEATRVYEASKLVAEESYKSGKARIKEAIKQGGDAESVARGILNECDIDPPVRRRSVANDPTMEKLGELLSDNPNGFLIFRDELTGFLRSLDRDGQEGARSFYLESWNGDGRYTFDRIGRGTIDIDSAITSILGGIQPGPISEYVRGAASDGRAADGLLQRFQLVCWPDVSRNWKNVDRWPDTGIKNRAHEVYRLIDGIAPQDAAAESDGDEIPYIRFDDGAQARFDDWRADLEGTLRTGDDHPAFEAHLSKYRSLIPSIALICHLADGGTGPVGIDALDRAIHWGDYLESHARRLYGAAASPEISGAHTLESKIKSGELKDRFTVREVYRHHWSGLANSDDARRAVALLEDCQILRKASVTTNGKPRTTYLINPRIFQLPTPEAVPKVTKGTFGTFGTPSGGGDRKISGDPQDAPELDPIGQYSPDEPSEDAQFSRPAF